MEHTQELDKALAELNRITGLEINIKADTPEELDNALAGLRSLSLAYREKYDRDYFFRNLLMRKLSDCDITEYALRLHVAPDIRRNVFILETKSPVDDTVTKILKNIFTSQSKIHFILTGDHTITLLRPEKNSDNEAVLEHTARMIVDTLNTEALINVKLAYSTASYQLSELSKGYEKVCLALNVGKLFYPGQTVFSCSRLGVGRLIYKLPISVCEDFLSEVFKEDERAGFDEETMHTINKFFENDLNIAETARQLHMHRNTLIYRLEQIEKKTGLDLRRFDDAMTFKAAIMVINYLQTERIS